MRAIPFGDDVAAAHGMRYPASVPAVALLVGIWVGWSLTAGAAPVLVGLAASLWAVSLIALCLRSRQAFVAAAAAAFTAVGAALGAHAVAEAEQTSLSRWFHGHPSPAGTVVIWGQLQRDATPTDYGVQLQVRVERLEHRRQTVHVTGGLRASVGGQLVEGRRRAWVAGRRVRMPVTLREPPRYQNPGVGEQRRRLAWRGTALFGSVKSALLVEVVEPGWWWQETAASARAWVRHVVQQTVGSRSAQSAGIVTAILIGDRAGLDDDTQRRLQEGGTFHVIAISGGNIAILAGLILVLLRAGGLAPPKAAALTIVSLVAYWQVVGFEASVSRATLGASLFLAARAVDHRTPALNALAVSAICLAAENPLVLSDAGFLLTFGATLGILVGVPRVLRVVDRASWLRSRRWVRTYVVMPPVGLLAATVCAELVLLPVAASSFSRVTIAGLALNFVAIPLMTMTQVAGLTAVLVYPVSVPIADLCGQIAHLATQGITSSAHLVELVPQLARRVPPPERFISVLYCAALVLLVQGSSRAVRTAGGAAGAMMAAVIVLGWPMTDRTRSGCPPSALRVVFLDVDQADATLLIFPSGHSMLVDAGGSVGGRSTVGERVVAPALWRAGVARLDYLVLTHGDPDHAPPAGPAPSDETDFRPWVASGTSLRVSSLRTLSTPDGIWSYRVFSPRPNGAIPARRLPTLYLHDGHSLLSGQPADHGSSRGRSVLSCVDHLAAIRSALVVAVYPRDRNVDYTSRGLQAYGDFMASTLKPQVDRDYPTLAAARDTAVLGASLGGVAALYLAWHYPDTFGMAACLSSCFGYADSLRQQISASPGKPVRIYLDSGWPRDNFEQTLAMQELLQSEGRVAARDLQRLTFPGAHHQERSWRSRLTFPYRFLFES